MSPGLAARGGGGGRGVVKQESGRVSREKMTLLGLDRWFPTEGNLASRGHRAMSGDIFDVRTEADGAPRMEVKTGTAAKYSSVPRTDTGSGNSLVHHVHSTEGERPWFGGRTRN